MTEKATKVRFLRGALVVSLPFLFAACAHAELRAPPAGRKIQAEFPVVWLEQILFAYRDFQTSKQDPTCFVLESYRHDNKYLVNFLPADLVVVEGDDIRVGGSCGQGVSYEFDLDGKFARKVYQK